jgi:hypothetical protein
LRRFADGEGKDVRSLSRHKLKIAALACALVAPAAPARAATQIIPVNAAVLKPLSLAWIQDLDLGSIVLGPGIWSGAKVSITRDGVFSCATVNLTCSGATQVAKYRATGSNNQTVRVSAPNVTLVNQADTSQSLVLVVDAPTTAQIPNSGVPGTDIGIGGSITLSSTTAGGVYVGTFNVTVDYQ